MRLKTAGYRGNVERRPTDDKRAPYKTTVLFELCRRPEEDRSEGVERQPYMDPFLHKDESQR